MLILTSVSFILDLMSVLKKAQLHQNNKAQNGFTIVELLIVIVIIAILAAITIVSYNGIQRQAKITKKKADIANITKAVEVAITTSTPVEYNRSRTATQNTQALTTLGLGGFSSSFVVNYAHGLNSDVCTSGTYGMTKDKYCLNISTNTVDNTTIVWWNEEVNEWYITYIDARTGRVDTNGTSNTGTYPEMYL